MTTLIEAINDGWSWKIGVIQRLVATNPFGNCIVLDGIGSVWRIIPEDLSADILSSTIDDLDKTMSGEDFQIDWKMDQLVKVALAAHGDPGDGRCFCLKIPGVLGGSYSADNIGVITVTELLSCSGSLARQINTMPDGTAVQLDIVKGDA